MHAARRAALQGLVAAIGADAALITTGVNVTFLTGLVSSNAAVLQPADGPAILATDSRYAGTAERECPDVRLAIERSVEPALVRMALASGLRRIAFEAQEMTVQRHSALAELDGSPELVPLGTAVEELRMVKDESEIELLARA